MIEILFATVKSEAQNVSPKICYIYTRLHGVNYVFYVVCTVHFSVSLIQNQQKHKIINKYKLYLQPLRMFRQINYHPQWVFIKELQVLIASRYTVVGIV
jgi:hypothetical protein